MVTSSASPISPKAKTNSRLECGTEKLVITLNYKPQTNRHLVRSIYAVDSSGDTNYQSPLADDPQNYQEKFGTAMLLLQSLTAEWMHDQGFGRLTFNLELDEDQKVIVHTFKDASPKEKYFGMDDLKWWREMYGLVEDGGFPTREAKNVVVAGYTYFDPEKKQVFAHTALGGGGLGLFGSGGMFTWPNSLEDSFRAFSDTTAVDPNIVHNDSAGRDNHWGMAATTIGAVCHELGHTFGLPHTNNNRGIMSRGFDHLNRMFAFADAPSARQPPRASPLGERAPLLVTRKRLLPSLQPLLCARRYRLQPRWRSGTRGRAIGQGSQQARGACSTRRQGRHHCGERRLGDGSRYL